MTVGHRGHHHGQECAEAHRGEQEALRSVARAELVRRERGRLPNDGAEVAGHDHGQTQQAHRARRSRIESVGWSPPGDVPRSSLAGDAACA